MTFPTPARRSDPLPTARTLEDARYPDLRGRAIVVPGAGGGLGVTLTRRLLEAGARVFAVVRQEADVQPLREALGALGDTDALAVLTAELTEGTAVAHVFDVSARSDGGVWGLVNVAGGYLGGPSVGDLELEALRSQWQINVETAFLCTRAAVQRMLATGRGGRVVNLGSAVAGRATAGHFAYAAAKSAVLRLTEAAAAEYGAHGITVNAVLPGMIATPANVQAMPDADQSGWVSPEQVSEVVLFLLSEAASGVNGAGIAITGRG